MTGSVIWITGPSGAGKTTVANALVPMLIAQGHKVFHLDGDAVRATLPKKMAGYSRDERLALAAHYVGLALIAYEQGFCVVVSTVSLFKEIHARNRQIFRHYLEVLLSAPSNILRQRDIKGVYDQAGSVPIVGVDIPADLPSGSDVIIIQNHGVTSIEDCANIVLRAFSELITAQE